MCFSADASLTSGIVLTPVGAYCMRAALAKNPAYLAVSATPLLFGVQQLCEAGVWRGLESGDPTLTRWATTAYLFFAIAFWPGWVPFGVAALEPRPRRRALLYAAAAAGLGLGIAAYVPAILHYGEWLEVSVAGHSIRYDFSRLPSGHNAASIAWQVLYLLLVCAPLLTSHDRELRLLGVSIAVAAGITQAVFRIAFVSVWCFFAAWLSIHIGYVLYRLPRPADRREVGSAAAAPAPAPG